MMRRTLLIAAALALAAPASAQEKKSPPLERLLDVPRDVREQVDAEAKSRVAEQARSEAECAEAEKSGQAPAEAQCSTPSEKTRKEGGPTVTIESQRVETTVPTMGVEERKARVTVGKPEAGDVSISVEGGTRQQVHDRREPTDAETVGGVRIEIPLPGQKPAKPRKKPDEP